MRSPSSAPCENGLDGSTETTPTVSSRRPDVSDERADQRRLPDPGRPRDADRVRAPGVGIQLAYEVVRRRVAVLDEADRARERPPIAGAHAGSRARSCVPHAVASARRLSCAAVIYLALGTVRRCPRDGRLRGRHAGARHPRRSRSASGRSGSRHHERGDRADAVDDRGMPPRPPSPRHVDQHAGSHHRERQASRRSRSSAPQWRDRAGCRVRPAGSAAGCRRSRLRCRSSPRRRRPQRARSSARRRRAPSRATSGRSTPT